LLENLIPDNEAKAAFKRIFKILDRDYVHDAIRKVVAQVAIKAILKNDWHSTTIETFTRRPQVMLYRKWRKGKPIYGENPYIPHN
jgi:hypothetical protein